MKYSEGYALVDIDDISLDPSNPRHNPVEEDALALEELMTTKNFNNKIFALMKDILDYGQNPIDLIGLLLTNNNTLYSKEGNRRVAAIKILNNPNLIVSSNIKLFIRVNNLLKEYNAPPSKVMCYITRDQNILDHAMELKHQGEQGGAGAVTWGSNEKARHKRNKGLHDPIFAFLNKLEDQGILNGKLRENITKTNWTRLFSRDGQAWLEVNKIDGDFQIIGNPEVFKLKFQLITNKINGESHYIITNADARKKLFNELDIEFKRIIESN